MEFKEAFRRGFKNGKTITNGVYELRIVRGYQYSDHGKAIIDRLISFLSNHKDDWEIGSTYIQNSSNKIKTIFRKTGGVNE